tara:strand:+ start:5524 stop:5868 length:345 start_codon:yes stop_codon:yes gene_type:complete
MTDWKGSVKKLVTDFDDKKGAAVLVTPPLEGRSSPVQVTQDEHTLQFEGSKITPKAVRKWLWEQRECRALKRSGAFLFANYNEEDDKTYVGIGALASEAAAVRLVERRTREGLV